MLLSTDPNSGIPHYNDPKSLAYISPFQFFSLPLPTGIAILITKI